VTRRLLITHQTFDSVLGRIEEEGIEPVLLDRAPPGSFPCLADALDSVEGVLCTLSDRLDCRLLEANAHLKIISNVAVGYDNIDVECARRLSIAVTNTPGVLTDATADLVLALLLAVARRIPEGDALVRSGQWEGWQLIDPLLGTEVSGKTLGIFGMGAIGAAVARRARFGFGMEVIYHSRTRLDEKDEARLEAEYVSLADLIAKSDFISLHAPLTDATRDLFDAHLFAQMKDGAILINTARGGLVKEEALISALQTGRLGGVGLDVFNNEPRVNEELLRFRDRVILLPHIGSATKETRERMAQMAARDAIAVLQGRSPHNQVI